MASLNENALIDTDYYYAMVGDEAEGDLEERNAIETLINAVSSQFEKFCNRKLKARNYTYDSGDTNDYDIDLLHYAVFDAPQGYTFFFPTYPVNSISEFLVSGLEISAAAADDYDASDGYQIYPRRGKLIYSQGFDYSYLQNVQIKGNRRSRTTPVVIGALQYLCFSTIKQYMNAPDNEMLQSERIGNYTYKLMSPEFQRVLRGLAPTIFENLMPYKKVAFA